MMEEQSSICVNMPYRILEYITAALRSTIETEQALYGKTRVLFPVPKLYVTFVGLEEKTEYKVTWKLLFMFMIFA